MGLSRNKVAVSEGAAGSPPFYGDRGKFSRTYRSRMTRPDRASAEYGTFVVQFSGTGMVFEKERARGMGV